MCRLRTHTHACESGGSPRALAAQALQTAIDGMAEVITGNCEYFFAKLGSADRRMRLR